MSGIQVDISGTGEFAKALEAAAKRFPYSAEQILRKEARNVAKDLEARVNAEAKGHHYGGSTNPLASSFRPGKVVRSGRNITVAVTSKAPHYHLFELGHDLYSHNRKNKLGRGKPGTGKKIGYVPGRKTVARYMAKRSEYADLIGQELLSQLMKEVGL